MSTTFSSTPVHIALVLASLLGAPALAQAQTATVKYTLENVWLDPDISGTWASPQPMYGTFEWTYTVGDFENGSAQFISLGLPWTSFGLSSLETTVETKSIEIVLPGSYHDLGVDIGLKLTQPFAPGLGSPIDLVLSKFEIQEGVVYSGHVISGDVVPVCLPPTNYGVGSPGSGGIVPTITSSGGGPHVGSSTFQVDAGLMLGGTSCFVLLGFAKDQLPILGIDVLVNPANLIVTQHQATGSPGVPGAGSLQAPMPVPDNPALIGFEIDFQIVAFDPGAPSGNASASNGLTMQICQ